MSLRRALMSLPDDRTTLGNLRRILGYLDLHRVERLDCEEVARRSQLPEAKVHTLVDALAAARVVDFDVESGHRWCRFDPDSVLELEVQRFLRSQSGAEAQLQRGVGRFRDRYGANY